MNRTKIKNYAPQARRDFIQAVTDRAAFYGLTEKRIEPVSIQGDVALIAGRAFPKEVAEKRKALQERVERDGFGPTMEALAYTWFNRLVAIRYMELHGYLDHGYRVLSNPDPTKVMPEILEHAEHVELPGLNRDRVVELKLDGTRESELYRLLLVAQCKALHDAMPFLFERIGDETELVLPESLLHSDSIVRKLVSDIDEEDWQEVEIIGWLYQFYISERKDEIIGKVVASEDIPAATQLFTPNWIVKYLVQNTLGRHWLKSYPQSPLKRQMKYYIEPAEQSPEVQEQLRTITPTGLNPEEITFLDPACGSGHILVEAYDVFKAIYQERGYRARDIPRLILTKNLFGLEIDDRAAQLASFAVMMKARHDDRRIFEHHVQPNVRSFIETAGMDVEDIAAALNVTESKELAPPGQLFETEDNLFTRAASAQDRRAYTSLSDVQAIVDLFEHAETFGSLIQVPKHIVARISNIAELLDYTLKLGGLLYVQSRRLRSLIELAKLLVQQYDIIATNPPYMGSKGFNEKLRTLVGNHYPTCKGDLYAAFIQRNILWLRPGGLLGMVTMRSWMFLPTFQELREHVIDEHIIINLVYIGYNSFPELNSKIALAAAFCMEQDAVPGYIGTYIDLNLAPQTADKGAAFFTDKRYYPLDQREFRRIPGTRLAFWASETLKRAFECHQTVESQAPVRQGFQTGNNSRFVRYWHEISVLKLILDARSKDDVVAKGKKWVPYHKGGPFRKWYGNHDYVVAFDDCSYSQLLRSGNCLPSRHLYFKEGITWSALTSSAFGARYSPSGFTFSAKGSCAFPRSGWLEYVLALLNSELAASILDILAATLDFNVGSIREIPLIDLDSVSFDRIKRNTKTLIKLSRKEWDSDEVSWDFQRPPFLEPESLGTRIVEAAQNCIRASGEANRIKAALEEDNDQVLFTAYGLFGEEKGTDSESECVSSQDLLGKQVHACVSYSVGCTMGRYSLDTPGLVYAHGGNVGFDPDQYRTFPADPDGIVPVMEADWFADDAANRFVEFLGVAWPREHLDENLKFVADALGPSKGEQPRDTIRRFLATGFYKHHLQTYKRRPIYWLFSSGKQRAFQCLVYLHRYHEGTLARMRTEYVIPLQGKLASRIDQLAGDIPKATSTSHRKKLTQERDTLLKQQAELQAYDEKLRHFADMRISLDLDDGVKVNYGKFSDLLAEVKAVTGGRDEE